ncbi:hypothetical protein JCM10212_005420 [Sporobolomyces blumeae]
MTSKSLSKGTLGLKFMNRAAPPPSAPSTPSTSLPTSTRATPAEPSKHAHSQTIVHESSLLNFPLLASSSSSSSTRSTSFQFTAPASYYSSMPLTSTAISGRRSFGGANVEIEKLNDPSSHPPPSSSKDEKSSKKAKKKDKKHEPVNVRRSAQSFAPTSARSNHATKRGSSEALDDDDREPTTQKRRKVGSSRGPKDIDRAIDVVAWEGGEDEVSFSGSTDRGSRAVAPSGFRKPAGFEGVKGNGGPARRASGNATRKRDGLIDGDHEWIKRGETREWDRDKGRSSDEDEDEDVDESELERRILDGSSSEDDEEESASDSDSDVRDLLVAQASSKGKGKAQAASATKTTTSKAKQDKAERVEREVERTERRMMGESGTSKGRKDTPSTGGRGSTLGGSKGKSKGRK